MQISINVISTEKIRSQESDFGNHSSSSFLVSAMAVNSSEECQLVHSVVVVLPERGAANPQYEAVPDVCIVEVPHGMKNEICFNSESNLLNHAKVRNLDVDIEKGKAEVLKPTEESIGYLKSDDHSPKPQQRGICLQTGGKFIQFLMEHSLKLPKVTAKDRLVAERFYDAPTNRSRKLRRSSSFNSRKVVFLFSVMSSMGTIILIYLTLRVRLISDGFGNV